MIKLKADEQALVDQIDFDVRTSVPYEERLAIFDRAGSLMDLLLKRNAFPAHRLDWFSEPENFIGGHGSSREQRFRQNARPGEDIFRHPNFLKYLQYFVYGPKLPGNAMSAFEVEVEDCGMITSGDVPRLASAARQQARTHSLDPKSACEEYYKLALECGLDADQARSIRDSVQTIR